MAQVILKRLWFAPGGQRIRRGVDGRPVAVPDELLPYLPRDAVVVHDDGQPTPAAKTGPGGKGALHEHDLERAAAAAEDEARQRAADFARQLEEDRKSGKRGK